MAQTSKRRSTSSSTSLKPPTTNKVKGGGNALTRTFSASKQGSSTGLSKDIKPSKGVTKAPSSAERDEAAQLIRKYPAIIRDAKNEMGPPSKSSLQAMQRSAVHAEDWDDLVTVLRVFDANPDFGPSSHQTRLERFNRAESLGLNPPREIGEILRSNVGRARPEYSRSTFNI
ncbi:hypothetical protein OIO90_005909 [Microbotryomycetes sp. JL221]|nr:hypothetical protein OIO90_005909 [Microbotryomycetes sp. JL221]